MARTLPATGSDGGDLPDERLTASDSGETFPVHLAASRAVPEARQPGCARRRRPTRCFDRVGRRRQDVAAGAEQGASCQAAATSRGKSRAMTSDSAMTPATEAPSVTTARWLRVSRIWARAA